MKTPCLPLVALALTLFAPHLLAAERLFNLIPENSTLQPTTAAEKRGGPQGTESRTLFGITRSNGGEDADKAVYSAPMFAICQSDKDGEKLTYYPGTTYFQIKRISRYASKTNSIDSFAAVTWDCDLGEAKKAYKDLALDLKLGFTSQGGTYGVYVSYNDSEGKLALDTTLSPSQPPSSKQIFAAVNDPNKFKKIAEISCQEKGQNAVLKDISLTPITSRMRDNTLRLVIAGQSFMENLSIDRNESQIKGNKGAGSAAVKILTGNSQ